MVYRSLYITGRQLREREYGTMKKELQEKLFEKYPKLFRQKDLSIQQSCMPRGIEIEGDGWYWLLDKLCERIQFCIDWNHLEQIEFVQVKEELGKLRIYTNHDNERIDGMISFACHLSFCTCERCGSTENVDQTSKTTAERIITLCAKCKVIYDEERGRA